MEVSPMTFTHDGKERKCRRVSVKGDYSWCRQLIRRERIASFPAGSNPESVGAAVAKPVTDDELWDYMLSRDGYIELLHRCVAHFDQTFTVEEAEAMVLEENPFITQWLLESRMITPKVPKPSSTN